MGNGRCVVLMGGIWVLQGVLTNLWCMGNGRCVVLIDSIWVVGGMLY